jgi:hypothetical protein
MLWHQLTCHATVSPTRAPKGIRLSHLLAARVSPLGLHFDLYETVAVDPDMHITYE